MDFIKGTEQVKIDPIGIDISGASNILLKSDGKVGIGTNNPQYPLQVNGSHAIFSNTPELLLFKQFAPGRVGPTLDWGNTTYTDWKIKAEESGLKFMSGSSGVTTESITINDTGNIGIGISTPENALHVVRDNTIKIGNDTAWGDVIIKRNSETHYKDNLSLGFSTGTSAQDNAATGLTLSRIGNVGIGTTNPSLKLTVGGSIITQSDNSSITVGNSSDSTTTTNSLRLHYTTEKNAYIDYNDTTTGLHIRSYTNNVMVFSPTGNVGIGTSTPSEKLHVIGNVITTGNVGIGITDPSSILTVRGNGGQSSSSANGAIQVYCGTSGKDIDGMSIRASNNGNHIINFCNTDGGLRGKVAGVNGDSVRYDTTSDKRRKENIREMESMIDKVMAMKCRQFNWIEGKEEDYGFIAQEIYEIFPHIRPDISGYCKYKCCDEEEDDDEEDCCCYSNIDEPVDKEGKEYWYGLDYGHFTPYLCKALQESHTKVLSLEQRNNDLEQQVTSLSSRLEAVESILLSLQNN